MSDTKKIPQPKKRAPTLYFIIVIKLIKGSLLFLGALGVYAMAGKDLQEIFDNLLHGLHLDPEGKFFSAIGDRLDTVTPRNMHAVASWMFLYSLFLLVGGTGLAFRAPWAVWLAIGESAFFIPLEIFELLRHRRHELTANAPPAWFHHPKIGIFIVLALNILIVWYLLKNRKRLFRHHD